MFTPQPPTDQFIHDPSDFGSEQHDDGAIMRYSICRFCGSILMANFRSTLRKSGTRSRSEMSPAENLSASVMKGGVRGQTLANHLGG
jgi:hypothetical protein